MKSPAFQFYPDDYMGGKPGLMTPEQTHVYIWLLCLDWNQHGFLYEIETLARWCRVKKSVLVRAWPVVQECFACRDGRWFNERLEKERAKQEEYRQKMSENGKKGGRPAKAVGNETESGGFNSEKPELSIGKADVKPNESIPLPTPLPTKNKQQTPTPSGRTRGKPAPWMAEINRVWAEVFPEAKAPTGAAKMLSSIVDKFGIERVAAELGVYLRATKPQFLSLPKFTATFGGASRDAKAQNPTAYAARLIRFYVEHGFSQVLPIEQHDARIDELAAEHKIKDPERVKRELRIVAPWMTLRGMKQGESARYEERVAKLLQDAPGVAA